MLFFLGTTCGFRVLSPPRLIYYGGGAAVTNKDPSFRVKTGPPSGPKAWLNRKGDGPHAHLLSVFYLVLAFSLML